MIVEWTTTDAVSRPSTWLKIPGVLQLPAGVVVHLHVFFFGRPAGFAQLRGICLALWDDLLTGRRLLLLHPLRPALVAVKAAAVHGALGEQRAALGERR